jgi:hypothetical protein
MGIGPVSKVAWKLVRASPLIEGPEGRNKNAMQSRLARGVGTWNSRLSGACRRSHTWLTATVLLSGTAKDPWQELHICKTNGPFNFGLVKSSWKNRHARRHFQAAAHSNCDSLFSAVATFEIRKLDWRVRAEIVITVLEEADKFGAGQVSLLRTGYLATDGSEKRNHMLCQLSEISIFSGGEVAASRRDCELRLLATGPRHVSSSRVKVQGRTVGTAGRDGISATEMLSCESDEGMRAEKETGSAFRF